jgi:hypothetical protein
VEAYGKTVMFVSKGNLAKDAKLRIGVMHRVPADECKRKTKGGDKLSMHC